FRSHSQVRPVFYKVRVWHLIGAKRSLRLQERSGGIVVVPRPGIIQHGPTLCSRKTAVKIGPPPNLIPYIIALRTVPEHTKIKGFVVEAQINAIGKIRVGISQEGSVVRRYLAVTIGIFISKTTDSNGVTVIVDVNIRNVLFTRGTSLRFADFLLGIPETYNIISKERGDRMANLVPHGTNTFITI